MVVSGAMSSHWTLVTGATGFIGSNLVRRLVESGERVKAFVRAGSNLAPLVGLPPERCQLAYGDIDVGDTVFRALAGCDRMYHVAAVFKYSSRRPEDILRPTVEGTRGALLAARQRGIERVVVTSSAAVLGVAHGDEPMDETHPFGLSDPETYIRAKVEQLQVIEEMVDVGVPIVTVLPTAVFGPGDHRPTPNGRTLVDYLKMSSGRRIPASDGGISVVDVDDVAAGHIQAMTSGRVGEHYILGGDNVTYRQLFSLLHELTGLAEPGSTPSPSMIRLAGWILERYAGWAGRDPILTYKLARDYAFARVWVTSAKAERELGYTHRPARETLSRAIRWFLSSGAVPRPLANRVRLELRPV
jgi:dihydroflavonol-4-reductase